MKRSITMSRFFAWLVIAVAAVFLIVASAAFSPAPVMWLAPAIAAGTLVISFAIAISDRRDPLSALTAGVIVVISAWTIVASLVFSDPTVRHLALAESLAISGLAALGLTAHELTHERARRSRGPGSTDRESRIAAAA
jgi:hypothetical protein